MLKEAIALLTALGVTPSEDDPLLKFIIQSVKEQIKNETNQKEVPNGLHHLAVGMVVGQYLKLKKESGQLDSETIVLDDAAVKSLKEGDMDITFAAGEGTLTPEQRLDSLIAQLTQDRTREFVRYRRLKW